MSEAGKHLNQTELIELERLTRQAFALAVDDYSYAHGIPHTESVMIHKNNCDAFHRFDSSYLFMSNHACEYNIGNEILEGAVSSRVHGRDFYGTYV